jgi:hypothetical protein
VDGADTTAEAAPRRDETKMHCVKLLGQSLMARGFDRQVAELQIRAAVLNGYTALGMPVTEPMGEVRLGKGNVRASPFWRNKAILRPQRTLIVGGEGHDCHGDGRVEPADQRRHLFTLHQLAGGDEAGARVALAVAADQRERPRARRHRR